MTDSEEWRPVVGFEGTYEVSSLGRVRSLDRILERKGSWYRGPQKVRQPGKMLACALDGSGYPNVSLYTADGVRIGARVHNLVAAAFIGPCPEGKEVAHEDGTRTNCVPSNLRYDTRAGNLADKVRHGTRTGGEKHSRAKLTQVQVDQIKALRAKGMKCREIAPLFDVHPMHIAQLCRGGRWRP
jgi:hypothetical protein